MIYLLFFLNNFIKLNLNKIKIKIINFLILFYFILFDLFYFIYFIIFIVLYFL